MNQRYRWLRLMPLFLLFLFPACDTRPTDFAPGSEGAGGMATVQMTQNGIPDRYVVVMREGSAPAAETAGDMVAALGGRVHHTYRAALNGFAATLPRQAVEALQRNPNVAYIVQDGQMYMAQTVQPGATWGLDRIDQRDLPLSTTYSYEYDGEGVNVYVIDSGINYGHVDFEGRASFGADWITDGRNGADCNGHGTHVAGTIAGATWGVAKKANVISVRVFACSGSTPTSTVIAAVDWVTANHVKPAVANMSLGGGVFAPLNEAVQASIAAGVTYVVAAGNENTDACTRSPASTPEAITVGATTIADVRVSPANATWGSNFGACVNVFAPGLAITSAWWSSPTATNTIGGTSMASPHVAGLAALTLQANPTFSPAQIFSAIVSTSTNGRISDVAGSPNRLIFTGMTEEPPAPIIGLNPTSLTFTFVDASGTGASMIGVPTDSADIPQFRAAASGERKMELADASALQVSTALSSTASALVRLTNVGTAGMEWSAASDRPWLSVSPNHGSVAPGGFTPLIATASSGGLDAGVHNGAIAITAPGAANSPRSVAVSARVLAGTPLSLGTPITGLAAPLNDERYFVLNVPEGSYDLVIRIFGGTGDADLYVRYGDVPVRTPAAWDCRPFAAGNTETCTVSVPRAGTYYIMLHAWSAYSGLTLEASIAPTTPAAPSGLTATAVSNSRVDLTWTDNSANETSFQVQRSTRSRSAFGPFENVGSAEADATTFSDTSVIPDATYRYRIRACNAMGCSEWTESNQVATPKGGPKK